MFIKILKEIGMFVLCYGICFGIKLSFNNFEYQSKFLLEVLIIAILAFALSKYYNYAMRKKMERKYQKEKNNKNNN